MVQQRSRQESLADEAQREKNQKNKLKKGLKGDIIDKFRKFFEENPPSKIERLGPYKSPPRWFKRIDPRLLPDNLERRYKDLEKRFADKKENQGGSGGKSAKAKGGTIKAYAKGGGVRKVRNVYE